MCHSYGLYDQNNISNRIGLINKGLPKDKSFEEIFPDYNPMIYQNFVNTQKLHVNKIIECTNSQSDN